MRWNRGRLLLDKAAALLCLTCLAGLAPGVLTVDAARQSAPAPSARAADDASDRTQESFVMIDPAHGGDDKGATLGGKLLEKDFTLAMAHELKKELLARGIPARLLRSSDIQALGNVAAGELTSGAMASVFNGATTPSGSQRDANGSRSPA